MSLKTVSMTESLYAYYQGVGYRESEILAQLRVETASMPEAMIQISPEQGQFMALLVELMGAQKVVEIGTFTGYSALWMALSLPTQSTLIACDINEAWGEIAKRYWQQAGVLHKIDLRIGPALQTLDAMLQRGEAGTVDFMFIDADKENVRSYYERALSLLRQGGMVAIDNVLWSGRVADPNDQNSCTVALREINELIRHDERVTFSLVPISDGLTLARKR